MADLTTLEQDLAASLPEDLRVLASDFARVLRTVDSGLLSADQARALLSQPVTLAVLRQLTAASPAAITVGNIVDSQAIAIGAGATARVTYQGPGYPRPDYRSEIAARLTHLQGLFVGRAAILDQLTAPAASGYTVLTAPAAFGKSALSAQLVQRNETGAWPGLLLYVFLRQETGENTPVFVLQRLNAQLLGALNHEGGVPGDLEALRGQFGALWGQCLELSERNGTSITLLVDGLDEMAAGPVSVATLLPDRLGTHTRVIVTSRPSPDPASLVPLGHPLLVAHRLTLDAFTRNDIVELLQSNQAPGAVIATLAGEILALTKGEPLFARFVAEETAAAGAVPPALRDDAPKGVREYFARQVLQLTAAGGNSALTRDVLAVLTVARGPLSRRDLAEVVEAEPLDLTSVLAQIRRYLVGTERFELMHLELREALTDEFSARQLRASGTRLLSWCASYAKTAWPADTPAYVLDQFARHLASAGDFAGRQALIVNPAFRAAQRIGLGDIARTLDDVRAALAAALAADDVAAVIACAAAYRETLQHGRVGETVFAALDAGDADKALQRATICGADSEWAQVLWTYLAWEYALRGDTQLVARALGALRGTATPPLDALLEALITAIARALDGQDARSAADWLTLWGRSAALLQAYPEATDADPGQVTTTIQALQPMADHLRQQIEQDARSGMYEALAYFESGNEEESLRIRDLRAQLATTTALPIGRDLVEGLLRVTLSNPYPFYRDQALATLGVAALATPTRMDMGARDWLRRQLRAMLAVTLTAEGVTFTFELPAQILALRPAPTAAVAQLDALLTRGRFLVDRWGSHLRTHIAEIGAAARLGGAQSARQDLEVALGQPVGYAGYAVTTFLATADLCIELALDPGQIAAPLHSGGRSLLEAAQQSAASVRDPDFRARRALLVHLYRNEWPTSATPAATGLASALAALPERDIRLAYLFHLAAVWSAAATADRERLRALVPFALSDATTLDFVLARLLGGAATHLSAGDAAALAEACAAAVAADLATGRPWEYSARIGPQEPALIP